MLIGRTDDPQNPRRVAAFEVTNPFGGGSRNPSGPAVKVPRQTGRTHDRFSHQIKFFPHTPLHSKGRPHTPYEFVPEFLERTEGIEPSYAAWEAAVLPLNYAREPMLFLLKAVLGGRSIGISY